MFCPVCKGEFREGFTKCDICQVGLVEDLDNLPDYIEGEFKICPECHKRYDDIDVCPDCELKTIRVLPGPENGPVYVYLEEPDFSSRSSKDASDEFDLNTSGYEHCVDLKNENVEVLLETEDMDLMHKLMAVLNKAGFDFDFVPPNDQPSSTLGSIFGMNSPLARSFPQIVVRASDLQAATNLVAKSEDLGIFDVPEELLDDEEDEEDDDEEE